MRMADRAEGVRRKRDKEGPAGVATGYVEVGDSVGAVGRDKLPPKASGDAGSRRGSLAPRREPSRLPPLERNIVVAEVVGWGSAAASTAAAAAVAVTAAEVTGRSGIAATAAT
jgi:hypothetical protein